LGLIRGGHPFRRDVDEKSGNFHVQEVVPNIREELRELDV